MTKMQVTYCIQEIFITLEESLAKATILVKLVNSAKPYIPQKQGGLKREITFINLKIIAIVGKVYASGAATYVLRCTFWH